MSDFKRFVFVVLEKAPKNQLITHGVFDTSAEALECCNRINKPFEGPAKKSQAWVAMTRYHATPPMEP